MLLILQLTFTTPAKIKRLSAQNTSLLVLYTKHNSKVSDLYIQELNDLDIAPFQLFAVNCSAKICSESLEIPSLHLVNSISETPIPLQYYGEIDSDDVFEWFSENLRPNFIEIRETDQILQLLIQLQGEQISGNFLIVTCKDVEWYFYELAELVKAYNVQLIVQSEFGYEEYKNYEKVNFFDRIDEDGMNGIFAYGGKINFYPWEEFGSLFLGGNEENLGLWVGEIVKVIDEL